MEVVKEMRFGRDWEQEEYGQRLTLVGAVPGTWTHVYTAFLGTGVDDPERKREAEREGAEYLMARYRWEVSDDAVSGDG